MPESFDALRESVRQLGALLDDPQPGLATWTTMLGQRLAEVTSLWRSTDKQPLLSSVRSAKTEQVVHVQFTRGQGIEPSPVRIVDAWFTMDGELIAERDPCAGTVPEGM